MMLESDGFWNAVASLLFWCIAGLVLWRIFPTLRGFIDGRNIDIKLGDNGISIQQATSQLSEYVSDLQSRVARLESGSRDFPSSISPSESDRSRKRILWVDDFPTNNAVIMEGLRERPFVIETAASTHEALRLFTAFDYHLIITDLGRVEGGVNNPLAGLDLIEHVRRLNSDVPIIVFSGQRALKIRDRLVMAGATDVTNSGYELVKHIDEFMN